MLMSVIAAAFAALRRCSARMITSNMPPRLVRHDAAIILARCRHYALCAIHAAAAYFALRATPPVTLRHRIYARYRDLIIAITLTCHAAAMPMSRLLITPYVCFTPPRALFSP